MVADEIAEYVRGLVFPQAVDIEEAQRIILEYLSESGSEGKEETGVLIGKVQTILYAEPFPSFDANIQMGQALNGVKAELVAREAIQVLHTRGAIVAVDNNLWQNQVRQFWYNTPHQKGIPVPGISLSQPVVFSAYRIALGFTGQHFRLASSHLYIAQLDATHLPSRAKRCLEESIDAFRHGLYLSAVMNAGAASEGIWMELGRLSATKVSAPTLTKAVNEPHVFISTVIQET